MKEPVHTDHAPEAIGTYSQAIRHGEWVFLSGQIPLDPASMELVEGDIDNQIRQVLDNLYHVCAAAGGTLEDVVRVTVYLTDMAHFPRVNEVMSQYFRQPYPARAAVGVTALPKGAEVEMDAILLVHDGG